MQLDLDEYRQRNLESWARVSGAWAERRQWMLGQTLPVSEWLLGRLDLQPGQTLLELAAGTGDFSRLAAPHVEPGGRVITTDFSPEMVEAARRAGAPDNVELRVLDAERMDLGDDSADAVACRYGFMLMPDPAAAFAETRRVLRDGGPLAFAVWAGPEQNPWAAVPGRTLTERGVLPPPEPGAPGMMALAEPDRVRALLADAGFGEPELEEVAFSFTYADADALWDTLISLAGGIGAAVGELSEADRAAARDAVIEAVAPFRNEDGSYTAPATTLCAVVR